MMMDARDVSSRRNVADLDAFAIGYVNTMVFPANPFPDEALVQSVVARLTDECWKTMLADCDIFKRSAEPMLNRAYKAGYLPHEAGRDFCLSRNGMGMAAFMSRSTLDWRSIQFFTCLVRPFERAILVMRG